MVAGIIGHIWLLAAYENLTERCSFSCSSNTLLVCIETPFFNGQISPYNNIDRFRCESVEALRNNSWINVVDLDGSMEGSSESVEGIVDI